MGPPIFGQTLLCSFLLLGKRKTRVFFGISLAQAHNTRSPRESSRNYMELPDLYEGNMYLKPETLHLAGQFIHGAMPFPVFPENQTSEYEPAKKQGTYASDCHAAVAFPKHLCLLQQLG